MPEVGLRMGGEAILVLPGPEWLDPEDNGGAVKRFQLGLHYSLIYCDRPPRPAVTPLLPDPFWASSFRNLQGVPVNCKMILLHWTKFVMLFSIGFGRDKVQ